MKDVNTKPGEEQSPPAAPSVIRDERRGAKKGEAERRGAQRLLLNYTRGEENLPAFD